VCADGVHSVCVAVRTHSAQKVYLSAICRCCVNSVSTVCPGCVDSVHSMLLVWADGVLAL
jgi:hypothetical protein